MGFCTKRAYRFCLTAAGMACLNSLLASLVRDGGTTNDQLRQLLDKASPVTLEVWEYSTDSVSNDLGLAPTKDESEPEMALVGEKRQEEEPSKDHKDQPLKKRHQNTNLQQHQPQSLKKQLSASKENPAIDTEQKEAEEDLAIFYNVWLPPDPKDALRRQSIMDDILATQIELLGNSYAVQAARNRTDNVKLFYSKIGFPVEDGWMKKTSSRHNLEAVPMKHYENAMEDVTLHELREYCAAHPSHSVIYVHPKGSFHPRKSQDTWRKEGTMKAGSEDCAVRMAKGKCNACGARFSPMPTHFSGNFWRAKCSYVQQLRPPAEIEQLFRKAYKSTPPKMTFASRQDSLLGLGRYALEHWIGSHPSFEPCHLPQHFKLSRPLKMRDGPVARQKEYFLLPGLLWKYATVHNDTAFPPNDSWIWQHFPDGSEFRGAINSLGSLKGGVIHQMMMPSMAANDTAHDGSSTVQTETVVTTASPAPKAMATTTSSEPTTTTDHPRAGARLSNGTRGHIADVYRESNADTFLQDQETSDKESQSKGNLKNLPFKHYPQPLPQMHPFAGALDENQTWGYVHDPTVLRREPLTIQWAPESNDKSQAEVCFPDYPNTTHWINEDGYEVLSKIQIANTTTSTLTAKPRILCAIYTYKGNAENIQAIADTWGARCDGFLAASTYTHRATGTVHVPHFGTEGHYNSIWQKVRSLLTYAYTNFGHSYDYFHICGDDTYLVVENLREFLTSERVQNATRHSIPLYAGGWIKPFWRKEAREGLIYNGGGPGYTLNKHALELFIQQGLAQCNPNQDKSEEDLFMGLCFHQVVGLSQPFDTSDDLTHSARYHHQDPNNLLRIHSRNSNFRRFVKKQVQWRQGFLQEPKDPLQAVSSHSIAFHLIKKANYMRRLDVLLYPQGTMGRYCQKLAVENDKTGSGSSIGNGNRGAA